MWHHRPSFPPALQRKSKLARQKYQKAIKLVGGAMEFESEEEVAAASATRAACLLNLARCAEQELEWGEALGWCTKAIGCVFDCLRAAFGITVFLARQQQQQMCFMASNFVCPAARTTHTPKPTSAGRWCRPAWVSTSLRGATWQCALSWILPRQRTARGKCGAWRSSSRRQMQSSGMP